MESIELGYYLMDDGKVEWSEVVRAALESKMSIAQKTELPELPRGEPSTFAETFVQVANETTLGASKRLVDGGKRPLERRGRVLPVSEPGQVRTDALAHLHGVPRGPESVYRVRNLGSEASRRRHGGSVCGAATVAFCPTNGSKNSICLRTLNTKWILY